jgi:serine/threonine-protein kinase
VSLAVTAIGQHPVEDWLLEFSFPGNQRLSAVSGPVAEFEQVGRKVAVRAAAGSVLRSGRAQEIFLHGAYQQVNPLPLEFALDGRQCTVMVLGTAVVPPPVADTDEPTPVREATTGSSGSGSSGSAAGAPKSPAKSPKRATPKASPKKSAKSAARDEKAVASEERAKRAERVEQQATPPGSADRVPTGLRQLRPAKPGRFGATAV